MGITVKRISAYVTKPGWVGCRQSHLKCLMNIYITKEISVVYEDDVIFLYNREEFTDFLLFAMEELPKNWDVLYLGASPQGPQQRYSPHLYRLSKAWTTHAIMWNPHSTVINDILNAEDRDEIGKWDVFLSEKIMPNYNVFVTWPILCSQRQYKSDTCTRSDVSTILVNYKKYCP